MNTMSLINHIVAISLILPVIAFSLSDEAHAVCCFPYEITHYVDPDTGHLIVEGQLWNDSYKGEPFGNVNYQFEFFDSENNILFERDLSLTDGLPIKNGFVIPPIVALPFHIVIDDVDKETIKKIKHVRSGGNNTIEYFSWKPADLKIDLENIERFATINDQANQEIFHKWKISGTITNIHSEETKNVYVVASLLDEKDRFLGTAGYSNDDIQHMHLDGFEMKEFAIYSVLPEDRTPGNAYLYAESDQSSMVHRHYNPLILKNIIDHEVRHATDPKKPILISANVTNISRDNYDLDWIIQIKKSPKSITEGDMTKYPQSKVELIERIPIHVDGQQSILLEYPWMPQHRGIYFYEMFLWDDNNIPASYPFTGNFFSQGEMFVYHNLYSIKNQIESGISLDDLVCREELEMANKASNTNFVCIKPESIPKLLERGWLKSQQTHSDELKPNAFVGGITEIINEDHEPLKYAKTSPRITETFLGKNVGQWQEVSFDDLIAEHERYLNDEFFTELGRLLIKNEMANQMEKLGIINANDDFEVMDGMHRTSLPPHIGFSAVVNATDGHSYRLEGGTHANQVSYYRTTQLAFYDTAQKVPMESLVTKPQIITILPERGYDARAEPGIMIIHKNNSKVEFFNDSPNTVRIQDDGTGTVGEEHLLDWMGPTILPSQRIGMTFDKAGHYEWDGRKAPSLEHPTWWETHAGGIIVVLDDNMESLSQYEKARMAQAIITSSEIPVRMSGIGANDILHVGLDSSVIQNIPESVTYYKARIQQILPFEVEFEIGG